MQLDSEKYHREQPVKPLSIVWMLLLLNFLLALIVFLFPDGERGLAKNFTLQFVSASDLFNPRMKAPDLDTILQGIANLSDTSSFDLETTMKADSLVKKPDLIKRIQYPSKDQRALNDFFQSLLALEKGDNTVYRIIHYGDSQLEGDRISDYLRNQLQLRFGGNGPGVVLPIDVSRSRVSVLQSESKDWKKYAIYGTSHRDDGIYGIGASSYVYTGAVPVVVGKDTIIRKAYDSLISKKLEKKIKVKDTTGTFPTGVDSVYYVEIKVPQDSSKFHYDTIYKNIFGTAKSGSSWLRFRCASQSYPLVRSFNRVELIYQSEDTCRLTVQVDGKPVTLKLKPSPEAKKVSLYEGEVSDEVMINFSGPSPVVFGVLLDGHKGIAVDNFPMRGSSGTGYTTIRRSLLSKQYALCNVKLIILQYGINVVPHPRKNYDFYERMFLAELQAIKEAAPGVSVLVIGPSDMSMKSGGEYTSYPNVPLIRNAMRNAAFKTGCAFWDLYSAMGGPNSMVSWVNANPSLASKDYTHFNARGARYVGEMLYDALLSEYIDWKKELINSASEKKVTKEND
ncbi:MAG: hypothetical protein GC181_14520 [Bacteroidetes bacterium]|nr:hypothetical protein [Bacteroidota bacterium]